MTKSLEQMQAQIELELMDPPMIPWYAHLARFLTKILSHVG